MKKFLAGLMTLFLILAVALGVIVFNIDSVVKTAVNAYGPKIIKTPVELGLADVALFKTEIALENFVLGNPKGFSSPYAISIGSMIVDIDEDTLLADTIIIDRIEVVRPEIVYEINGKTVNFRAIQDNMKKPQTATPSPDARKTGKLPKKEPAGEKVIIREMVLRDITVKTVVPIAGGDIAVSKISEIHLKNIGQEENGVGIAQAVMMILNDLAGQIVSTEGFGGIKPQLKGLGDELDGVCKEIKSIGDQFKSLIDR